VFEEPSEWVTISRAMNQGEELFPDRAISKSGLVAALKLVLQLILLATFLLAAPGATIQGADSPAVKGYQLGHEPGWVVPSKLAIPSPRPAEQVQAGEVFLLVDEQVNVRHQEFYGRYAKKLLTESGVQDNGSLRFGFEPTYETLTFHQIAILRGTNRMDQLAVAKINVIQQETELNWNIYNGRLSVIVFLNDLRVGDIVEYAYTLRGANPILDGRFAETCAVQWGRPVERQTLRLLRPKERKLFIRNHGVVPSPVLTQGGQEDEYRWLFEATPAVMADEHLPIWYNPYAMVQFSEFSSWAEIADWALKLFEVAQPLSPELQAQIATWRELPSEEARVLAALRFVQDEVRYLGIEIGPYSHKPSDPSLVFARRFGDCKDKSLLFCAILRQMNIEAFPALVHTTRRQTVAQWHPTPFAFNHVIVRVEADGQIRWLDPTRSHQRGALGDLFLPNYARALVIQPGATNLSELPFPAGGRGRLTVHDFYTIKSYETPVEFRVRSYYEGVEADRMRGAFADTRREELEKEYLNFYSRTHAKIKMTHPLQTHDDAAANVIEVVERYEIDQFWSLSDNKRQWLSTFYPHSIGELIDKPGAASRTMPLAVPYPQRRTHVMEVHLPEKWQIKAQDQSVESKAMRMRFRVECDKRKVQLNYQLETLADFVPASEVGEHIKALDQMEELLTYQLYRSRAVGGSWLHQINWPILFVAGLYFVLLALGALFVYRRVPALVSGPPPLPPIITPGKDLRGIRGWLILVAVGVVLTPLRVLYGIITGATAYSLDTWQAITTPGTESDHPLWAPFLIFELLANLTLWVYSILLLILFFQQRRAFPKLYVIFLAATLLVLAIDYVLGNVIPDIKDSTDKTSLRESSRAGMTLLIWGSYFLVSKRVKATFVR